MLHCGWRDKRPPAAKSRRALPLLEAATLSFADPCWPNEGGETMTRWIQMLVVVVGAAAGGSAQNSNGIGGIMPAYYDDQLFTINFKELPPGGEGSNLGH